MGAAPASSSNGKKDVKVGSLSIVSCVLVALLSLAQGVGGQEAGSLVGRVVDASTGGGISDATIVVVDGDRSALTDSLGFFGISSLPPGGYTIQVVHLAYGEFRERVQIEAGEEASFRIMLSPTAIELEPVVVEALTETQFQARSRGTRRNVITREEIEPLQNTGGHLGHILARHIPGIRLRSDQNRTGEPICIEFRTPVSLRDPLACKPPITFLDGVRVSSPSLILTTLPPENINRMEVIPPGEAGVAYGTDSRYGVLLIETVSASDVFGQREEERIGASGARYDWALEPNDHDWKRVLGYSFVGSALGIALAYAAASPCLSFDGISEHFYEAECGSWGNAGGRVALATLPQIGASLGARIGGRTDLSQGKLGHALIVTTFLSAPGVILSLTTTQDGFSGSRTLGHILLGLGVPVVATLSDWMFRSFRGIPSG